MKQLNEKFFLATESLSRSEGDALAKMIAFIMPDAAVFTVDRDKKITYWSPGAEKLLGFSEQQLKGEICLSGNRCQQCMQGCGLVESGKVEGLALQLHAQDGAVKPVTKYAVAYVSEAGSFDGGLEVLIPQTIGAEAEKSQQLFTENYGLISHSPEMAKVFELIRRVSQTDMPVLVRGESGTGKELVARAIHQESPRRKKPFIAINCATLSAGLLESELFGHVKGAFTGAIREHAGVFERASGGTLFLDEIAELPIELQAKLLRVLETGEFVQVGGERPIQADVRIITATHKALRDEVKNGHFRQDLLYRLRVIPIFLPNLKARSADIPLLVRHILQQQLATQNLPIISPEAMHCLMHHDWPGNVRELKNAIHYALVMFDGTTIQATDLPPEVFAGKSPSQQQTKPSKRKRASADDVEKQIAACDGNLTQAARQLGISRTSLWRYRKNNASTD